MKRLFLLVLLGVLPWMAQAQSRLQAQELNATVKVDRSKIQGTNDQVYTTLQKDLTEFINNRKWTDATFGVNERIDCTFTITVKEATDNSYKAELLVQARRPVYNSSYTTTLLNFRDTELNFDYVEFDQLEFNENSLNSNLTASIVFYIYTILGLDFDSFALKGGSAFYQQAQNIVALAQAQPSWTGWKAFDSDRNRHALITALTDNTSEQFREMWYTYHRKGLDEMAANPDRGRTTILSLLPVMEQIKSARPTSAIVQQFADAKLDEIVAIYSKATTQEKQEGYKILSNMYPALTTHLEPLKK